MRALLATIALLLALAAPVAAQQPRTEALDLEDEVMCVSCNVPLFIAESPQADRQRVFIRELVAQGLTKDQVKARLVDEYGQDVLAMPENDGTGLAAKIVPVAVVLLLIAGLALLIPRWRRRTPAAALATAGPAPGAASEAELKRLDEDLKRLG